jgi:hypothetical protein
VPAVAVLLRRRPPGTALLVALLAAGWANATFLALTMHGWWWPGRQTVVVLPLAVIAIAGWASDDRRASADAATAVRRAASPGRRRALLAIAGGAGVVAQALLVIGVSSGRHTLIVDFDRTIDPLVHWAGPFLPDRRADDVGSGLLLTAWTVALAAWAVLAWHRAGRPSTAPAPVLDVPTGLSGPRPPDTDVTARADREPRTEGHRRPAVR